MPIVKFLPHPELCAAGKTVDIAVGASLCEAMLENGIAIEHACEMSRACTTCHVVVREGFNSLEGASDDEEDLLDRAWGLTAQSRLSCQVKIASSDLTIEIPKYTINHARENH
jgi:ferredoxin, 2Fe-2S